MSDTHGSTGVPSETALEFIDYSAQSAKASSVSGSIRPAQEEDDETPVFNDTQTLLPTGANEKYGPPLWSIDYYRKYFDVGSAQVGRRILKSVWPFHRDFLDSISSSPDMYGPFWIATTLIFAAAMTGNLSSYLASFRLGTEDWRYDFSKVTFAASAIYGYATLVPVVVWAILRYVAKARTVGLMEVICIYGYSLFIYIPVSILCIVHNEALRWSLVYVGMVISGSVLVINFYPFVARLEGWPRYGLPALVFVLHGGLATAFKFYFFEYAPVLAAQAIAPDAAPTASPTPTPTLNS
eukprot:Opistho-2@28053